MCCAQVAIEIGDASIILYASLRVDIVGVGGPVFAHIQRQAGLVLMQTQQQVFQAVRSDNPAEIRARCIARFEIHEGKAKREWGRKSTDDSAGARGRHVLGREHVARVIGIEEEIHRSLNASEIAGMDDSLAFLPP